MRRKRSLVSVFAVLALMTSVMVPAALAEPTAGTTTATVTLTDGGIFQINFCGSVGFGSTSVTSTSNTTLDSSVEICYKDSQSWRPGFKLQLSASEFTSNGSGTIPATNLTLGEMYNPYQGQWDAVAGTDVGDIGAWAGPTSRQVTKHESRDQQSAGHTAYDAPADLATPRYVAYAWDGAGTASGDLQPPTGATHDSAALVQHWEVVDGTYQVFGIHLEIPAGTPAGFYTSNLTLTYIPGAGYP